jgi:putative ABC transport system permease protein
MARRIPLAWLQLRRQPLRTLVGVAGVAFAVTLIFMQLGFAKALFASAVRFHQLLRADVVLVNPLSEMLPRMTPFARVRLHQALAYPGVESVASVYADMGNWKNLAERTTRGILVAGLDPADDSFELPEVRAHRERLRYPDVIFFDEGSRPEFGPVAATWLAGERTAAEIENRRVHIGGLFAIGTSFGIDGTIITSDLNFLRVFRGRDRGLIDIGLIRVKPGAEPVAVRDGLRKTLPRDVEVLTKADLVAREISYWATTTPIGFVFNFGVVIGIVVGAIIVYQILFADITEHLPEYATLKAMGYTNGYVVSVVVQQACLLALLGYVPGLVVSFGLYRATAAATRLPMDLSLGTGVFVLALTIAMCVVSAAIAMRKVRSADPAEIF